MPRPAPAARSPGWPILTEHDDAWLNADVGAPRWLDDGSGLLWMTEASGYWVLELRTAGGALVRALTRPELGLRELVAIDDGAAIRRGVHRSCVSRTSGGFPPRRRRAGAAVERRRRGPRRRRLPRLRRDRLLLRTGGRRTVAISASGRRELPSAAERPGVTPTTQLEDRLARRPDPPRRDHPAARVRPRPALPGAAQGLRRPARRHGRGRPRRLRDGPVVRRRRVHRRPGRRPRHAAPRPGLGARRSCAT